MDLPAVLVGTIKLCPPYDVCSSEAAVWQGRARLFVPTVTAQELYANLYWLAQFFFFAIRSFGALSPEQMVSVFPATSFWPWCNLL